MMIIVVVLLNIKLMVFPPKDNNKYSKQALKNS